MEFWNITEFNDKGIVTKLQNFTKKCPFEAEKFSRHEIYFVFKKKIHPHKIALASIKQKTLGNFEMYQNKQDSPSQQKFGFINEKFSPGLKLENGI